MNVVSNIAKEQFESKSQRVDKQFNKLCVVSNIAKEQFESKSQQPLTYPQ